jgi:hypothetical protein
MEEKPNNTLNKHSNRKQLLNAKTSSITEPEIKIKEIANKKEEKERKKRQEEINTIRTSNPYLNPSLNPSLAEGDILTFPNPNRNPTRNEVIKLDRTAKYVLKLPHASKNKDRKLDQNKKKKNTNQNLNQNLGSKDLPNTSGRVKNKKCKS